MDQELKAKLFGAAQAEEADMTSIELFGRKFLETYLRDGLGVMSKKETEILVVSRLDELGIFRNLGNSEASRLLRLPESRIATLRYEALLRYPPESPKTYVQRELMIALLKSDFDSESGRIRLMLENKYVRSYLKGEFTKHGKVLDRSFDSDIASAKPEALFAVLEQLFSNDFADFIRTRIAQNETGITRQLWETIKRAISTDLVDRCAAWGIDQAANADQWLEIIGNLT